jgi:hypothetical protein
MGTPFGSVSQMGGGLAVVLVILFRRRVFRGTNAD